MQRQLLLSLLLVLWGHVPTIVRGSVEQHEIRAAAESRRVHAFFYLWYGTPEYDGKWQHWNHEVLPHWDASIRDQYPSEGIRYVPPGDVHSPFYPMRGCYSSRDAAVTRAQLRELLHAGVGVVVLSWSGRPDVPGTHDTQGISTDNLILNVMDIAKEVGMEVALHLEPYHGRSALSVSEDFAYIMKKFGVHPALHRTAAGRGMGDQRELPVLYVYDSYRIPVREWQQVLMPMRTKSARNTDRDVFAIGLWLEPHDGEQLYEAGFDGAYTYFASDGFTYGSSTRNWRGMAEFAQTHGLLFIPSVGPGYDDSRIRPWNKRTSKERMGGRYYEDMWSAAVGSGAQLVSITSYNEWGEGTQIEPAVPKTVPPEPSLRLSQDMRSTLGLASDYLTYEPNDEYFYLNRTGRWAAYLASQLPHSLHDEF
jgi:glycoprotein endo-alpha-1,2-mannosidase